jgi:hypothetical protein
MSKQPLLHVGIEVFEGVAVEEFDWRIYLGGTRRGGVAVSHGVMGDGQDQTDAWAVGKLLRGEFFLQVQEFVPHVVMRLEPEDHWVGVR